MTMHGNINSWTPSEKAKLIGRGARWLVVTQYTRNPSQRKGDIVSWHKTHEAAGRAAWGDDYVELRDIRYCDADGVPA
jgi:hypothetical protein